MRLAVVFTLTHGPGVAVVKINEQAVNPQACHNIKQVKKISSHNQNFVV